MCVCVNVRVCVQMNAFRLFAAFYVVISFPYRPLVRRMNGRTTNFMSETATKLEPEMNTNKTFRLRENLCFIECLHLSHTHSLSGETMQPKLLY